MKFAEITNWFTLGVNNPNMKHAVLILAVFLCLSAASQKTSFPIKNELPAYKPVNLELYKKFKSPDPSFVISNSSEASGFSFVNN